MAVDLTFSDEELAAFEGSCVFCLPKKDGSLGRDIAGDLADTEDSDRVRTFDLVLGAGSLVANLKSS